jgi:hypothetical protein
MALQATLCTPLATLVCAQAVAQASGPQLSSSFLAPGLNRAARPGVVVAKQRRSSHAGISAMDGFLSMLGFGSRGAPAYDPAEVAIAQGPDDDAPASGCQFACFGAGCFWGVELAFQRVPGVTKTEVGYTHGQMHSPTYDAVCSGATGITAALLPSRIFSRIAAVAVFELLAGEPNSQCPQSYSIFSSEIWGLSSHCGQI